MDSMRLPRRPHWTELPAWWLVRATLRVATTALEADTLAVGAVRSNNSGRRDLGGQHVVLGQINVRANVDVAIL